MFSDSSDEQGVLTLRRTGWGDWNFGAMQYGPEWRTHRRVFHRHFQIDAVKRYKPVQESRVRKYIQQLYKRPEDLVGLNRQCVLVAVHTIGLTGGKRLASSAALYWKLPTGSM